jgi:hypothetical protein
VSYNIDTFKVKKLKQLRIPLEALYKLQRNLSVTEVDEEIPHITFKSGEGEPMIWGKAAGSWLEVEGLEVYGEWSGTLMRDLIAPALEESTGVFEASLVWEGGDSINRLIVKDGNVTWEDIDI